jgi:hypothetical protein
MDLRDGVTTAATPPPAKKPKTSGSGMGKRKVKVKQQRGRRGSIGGNSWDPHHGNRTAQPAGERQQGASTPAVEQGDEKRRRTAATTADAGIAAAAAAATESASGDDGPAYKRPRPVISPKARRFAIAVCFADIYGAPPECEWDWLSATRICMQSKLGTPSRPLFRATPHPAQAAAGRAGTARACRQQG